MSTVVVDEITQTLVIDEGETTRTLTMTDEAISVVEVGIQGPAGSNGTNIRVSTTPPTSPTIGDMWVDTN